jgi:hypothetical protein
MPAISTHALDFYSGVAVNQGFLFLRIPENRDRSEPITSIGWRRAGGRHLGEVGAMQSIREDRAPTWRETRLSKALCPWIALGCLLAWAFCLLVLLPLFVVVLSIANLCRGKKPRLLARDPEGVEFTADYE